MTVFKVHRTDKFSSVSNPLSSISEAMERGAMDWVGMEGLASVKSNQISARSISRVQNTIGFLGRSTVVRQPFGVIDTME